MNTPMIAAPAAQDIRRIRAELAERSEDALIQFRSQLASAIQDIQDMPHAWTPRSNWCPPGYARELRSCRAGDYLVVYVCDVDPCVVLRIAHEKQDIPALIGEALLDEDMALIGEAASKSKP